MAQLINTGFPAIATEFGAALQLPPPVFSGFADVSRATILAEDIAECIAAHGRVEMQFLLGLGWPLEELQRCEHPDTRRAARGYTAKVEQLERASMLGLIACLAASIAILGFALLRDLSVPGV